MSKTTITFKATKAGLPVENAVWIFGPPISKKLTTDVNGEATATVDQLFAGRVMFSVDDSAGSAMGSSLDIDATLDASYTWDGNQITRTAAVNDLDHAKAVKNAKIDQKTGQLIAAGFTHNTKTFSLSSAAQKNWIGVEAAKLSITFPLAVSTIDDDEYTINDVVEYGSFYLAGVAAKKGHLDSGRALKLQVNVCTTVAEVDAIVDNR